MTFEYSRAMATAPKRADLGASIEPFFARQPAHLRAILDPLRAAIEKAAPGATASIKWGNPAWTLDGAMLCALTAHKAHVNLVLAGDPSAFDDPDRRLVGEGKTGKHLKLTSADQLPPKAQLRAWLATAVAAARAKAKPAQPAKKAKPAPTRKR